MKISFASDHLKKVCLEQKTAVRELGSDSARKLRGRYSDLLAHSCVQEVHAGRPHPLKGERTGQFAVDLAGGHRLVFKPTITPPPVLADGSTDWSMVMEITIVFIGDYHD